ncbi:MAG: N-acetylmuramoyl-L-alanine amidase [Candidatus Omnitrophica bacterium]|nr:N-acetylmuramoyl-L-alanine amidase [Candidatus Omnitrophota bacterium]
MKIKKFTSVISYGLCAILLFGCATIPSRETLPTYRINGVNYVSLTALCAVKDIALEYDTFTRSAILRKDTHKINLRVGENLVLVDGRSFYLRHPVEIYQGMLLVPYRFREEILDGLFKPTPPLVKMPAVLPIKKVVIDAGHGGSDPGAIGRTGIREKVITLDIAKRLSSILRSQGIEVVMTRTTDIFVPLSRRVEIANKSGAELFLSIHANANRIRSLSGFEVYYVSPRIDDTNRALAAAQHERLNLQSSYFAGNSINLKAILWDMIYTANRAQSIDLARQICRAVNQDLETKILGIKGARFFVLKGVSMPAVLIEVGFLSNYNEECMLKNSYYRQKIAQAIARGIEAYAQKRVFFAEAR